MRDWKYRIHLTDLLEEDLLDLGPVAFTKARDAVVARFKDSDWYRSCDEDSSLHELVDELGYADNAGEFVDALDGIYDIADEDGAWIETLMSAWVE